VAGNEHAQDLTFMCMALEEAAKASDVGEVPIAALIVQGNQVLAQTHNYRELWQDPTAHAEVIAIRAAASVSESSGLAVCTGLLMVSCTRLRHHAPSRAASTSRSDNMPTR